jgi:putative transposase
MIPEYTLHAHEVHQAVFDTVTTHFSLAAHGYQCDTPMLINVLFKAATDRMSLEAACQELQGVADSNTVREYFDAHYDVCLLREHEGEMNAALAAGIPPELWPQELEVACDFHDEPFYGKTPELRTYACRGQAKKGTTHFFRVATAYVIWRQVRLTLAVTYVLPEETVLSILERLLFRLRHLHLRLGLLYLDKGFCSAPVITALTQAHQPTILACPIRGKQGGTRALCRGRKSYITPYTFSDGTSTTLLMKATFVPDKHGQVRKKWLAFVMLYIDWAPKQVFKRYRRRFGIECSYRMMRQVRVLTTSRNPALRFFLLGFGFVLLNQWTRLRWVFTRQPGPGPRRIIPERFRFQRFVTFLRHTVETLYGLILSIPTHLSPQSVIY